MSPTRLCIALTATLAACGPKTPPPLVADVQPGPAATVRPNRVLLLSASCGSVEYHCPAEFGATVDQIVRGGLEFAGYAVIDSDTLRKDTRKRSETHDDTDTDSKSRGHTDVETDWSPFDTHTTSTHESETKVHTDHVELNGSNFEDLSIDDRHTVMGKSGADAVVTVRIVVGGQTGAWSPNQNVEVQLKLGVNQGDTMAWAARCSASSNDFSTVTAALENAARCAVHGATAK